MSGLDSHSEGAQAQCVVDDAERGGRRAASRTGRRLPCDSIIGSSRSVVISPLRGMSRLSSSATPKPTITWPTTDTHHVFRGVMVGEKGLFQNEGVAQQVAVILQPDKIRWRVGRRRGKSVNELTQRVEQWEYVEHYPGKQWSGMMNRLRIDISLMPRDAARDLGIQRRQDCSGHSHLLFEMQRQKRRGAGAPPPARSGLLDPVVLLERGVPVGRKRVERFLGRAFAARDVRIDCAGSSGSAGSAYSGVAQKSLHL